MSQILYDFKLKIFSCWKYPITIFLLTNMSNRAFNDAKVFFLDRDWIYRRNYLTSIWIFSYFSGTVEQNFLINNFVHLKQTIKTSSWLRYLDYLETSSLAFNRKIFSPRNSLSRQVWSNSRNMKAFLVIFFGVLSG